MSWSAAAKLFLKSFIPLGGSFPAQLLCWSVVSHLTWTAFSAKPRLGLVLITLFFFFSTGSSSIFSCLWEGGGQISCEWKHRTDFCSTLTLHFDQRERTSACACLSCQQKGGRMALLWAFPSTVLSCCSETLSRLSWFRSATCLLFAMLRFL